MSSKSTKQQLKDWESHCEFIQNVTAVDEIDETTRQKKKRIASLLKDYRKFAKYYFGHLMSGEDGVITEPAKFHISEVNKLVKAKKIKLVEAWYRSAAKSTTFGVIAPVFLMFQEKNPMRFMLAVSKSEDMANNLLSDLQAEFESNQKLIRDFGEFKKHGHWMDGEFATRNGCYFVAKGRGQSPRGLKRGGLRPDYIWVDDFDDDDIIKNPKRMREAIDWLLGALFGCFNLKRYRFVITGNIIHKEGSIATLMKMPGWLSKTVNLLDKNGNPSWSENLTKEDCNEMIESIGYNNSQREYFNNPITQGTVFKNTWINYGKLPKLQDFNQLVSYCDPSFKNTEKSDYKAVKLWGEIDTQLWLIKSFVRRCSIAEMVQYHYDLYESLDDLSKSKIRMYMEANMLQDLLLDDFTIEGESRGWQLPVIPDRRKKPDKFTRIESLQPLYQRGFIKYNEAEKDTEDHKTGLNQLLGIEKGSKVNDDSPDADEGAIFKMQSNIRQSKCDPILIQRQHKKRY